MSRSQTATDQMRRRKKNPTRCLGLPSRDRLPHDRPPCYNAKYKGEEKKGTGFGLPRRRVRQSNAYVEREWLDGHSVRAGVLHQLDFGLGDLRSFLLLDDTALDLHKNRQLEHETRSGKGARKRTMRSHRLFCSDSGRVYKSTENSPAARACQLRHPEQRGVPDPPSMLF